MKTVKILAYVDRTVPDRTEYKIYRTELTFGGKLALEIEVPASEVRTEKGGVQVLTLNGWKIFLKNYTKITEDLNREYQKTFI